MLILALLACQPNSAPESAAPPIPAAAPVDAPVATDAAPPADPATAAPAAPVGPPINASVRLRFDPMPSDPAQTALTIEAFFDTKIVATGSAQVDGACKPAARPPAGLEEGAAFLQCDTATSSSIVKLVAHDGKAALVKRPTADAKAAYETFYELPPPANVMFDL